MTRLGGLALLLLAVVATGCDSQGGWMTVEVTGANLGTFGEERYQQNVTGDWDQPHWNSPGWVDGDTVMLDVDDLCKPSSQAGGREICDDTLRVSDGQDEDGGYYSVFSYLGGPMTDMWQLGVGLNVFSYGGPGAYAPGEDDAIEFALKWRGSVQYGHDDEAAFEPYRTFHVLGDGSSCSVEIESPDRTGSMVCEGLLPTVDGRTSDDPVSVEFHWGGP